MNDGSTPTPMGKRFTLGRLKPQIARPLTITMALVIGQLAVLYVQRGYTIGSVVAPDRDIRQIPMRMGPWLGEELTENARLQEFLQARSGIDRLYRNATGDTVLAHVVWTDDYVRIHYPEQCYRESGWEETASERIEITLSNQTTFPAQLLTFKRDGETKRVLYWFQMGDEFFFDRVRHRVLRRQVCWGKKEWPPLVKSDARRAQSRGKARATISRSSRGPRLFVVGRRPNLEGGKLGGHVSAVRATHEHPKLRMDEV